MLSDISRASRFVRRLLERVVARQDVSRELDEINRPLTSWLRCHPKLKVLRPVVGAITVNVMNVLAFDELPPEFAFHYHSMLCIPPCFRTDADVPSFSREFVAHGACPQLTCGIGASDSSASTTAEHCFRFFQSVWFNLHWNVTPITIDIDQLLRKADTPMCVVALRTAVVVRLLSGSAGSFVSNGATAETAGLHLRTVPFKELSCLSGTRYSE